MLFRTKFKINLPFIKIAASIIIGLIITLAWIPQQNEFESIITKYTTNFFETNFDCTTSLRVEQINIINGTCTFADILVSSKYNNPEKWNWSCQRLTIKIDWLKSIFNRKINFKITINKLLLNTYLIDQKATISNHLYKILFAPSTLPITLDNLKINNGTCNIFIKESSSHAQFSWNSETKEHHDTLRSNIYLKYGSFKVDQSIYLDQLAGQFQIILPINEPLGYDTHANLILDFKSPYLDLSDHFFINAKWRHRQLNCKLSSRNDVIKLNAKFNNKISKYDWQLGGQISFPNSTYIHTIDLHAKLGKSKWSGIFNLNQSTSTNWLLQWNFNKQTNQLHTRCDLSLFNKWLPNFITNNKDKVTIKTKLNGHKIISDINISNTNLVLPHIHNIIKSAQCRAIINLKNNNLQLKNGLFNLHQGKIAIPHASIGWSYNHQINYIYLPIVLTNLQVNYEKKLTSNLSGTILYQKDATNLEKLAGFVALDQTYCRYNLLSNDLSSLFNKKEAKNNLFNPKINLNIFTLSSIKIKSESIETNIDANLNLNNYLFSPQSSGIIDIYGGKINFPYKPLYITRGHINLTKNNSQIDLTAKNFIKNHHIVMYLSGLITNPQINFESQTLSEEQIGALLLAGTEKTSLNSAIPTLVIQNIFKPLGHFKFMPSFGDETGRNGLKGALEIDVNDRLHATIQKDFSLPEDTKFEIDYAVTDEFSIRGIKDEKGDLGGEVEFRLKI